MGVGVRSGYLGQFPNFTLGVKRKNGLCGSGLLNQCCPYLAWNPPSSMS